MFASSERQTTNISRISKELQTGKNRSDEREDEVNRWIKQVDKQSDEHGNGANEEE
jgi:hypothetical protein